MISFLPSILRPRATSTGRRMEVSASLMTMRRRASPLHSLLWEAEDYSLAARAASGGGRTAGTAGFLAGIDGGRHLGQVGAGGGAGRVGPRREPARTSMPGAVSKPPEAAPSAPDVGE